ncbi:hypothetical protein [Elizabethkingia anophelis]|uniref:hypothetical protein n=1 Tax=Elizabethkingia anophelis TaxID=1117645 RepID=UPI003786FB4A
MDKLELKDIAPYLPYKVKVQITEGYYAGKVKLLSGVQYDGLLNLGKGGRFGFTEREYHQVKLLLRPMSDLTKEITHNGETFVPINKLSELFDFSIAANDEYRDSNFSFDPDTDEWFFHIDKYFNGIVYTSTSEGMRGHYGEFRLSFTVMNKIVQKLCEWQIDFQDLIGRGLAININTLNNGK